jgi:hypothetical protein
MPYKDLPDSKGPLLYITFQILSYIPIHPNTSAWIFITILYCIGGIVCLKFLQNYFSTMVAFFVAAITFSTVIYIESFSSLNNGVICIPLLFIAMVFLIQKKHYFAIGIISSIVFWCKYLDVAPIVVLFIILFFTNIKEWKKGLNNLLKIIVGVIIVSIVVIGITLSYGYFNEMIATYFLGTATQGNVSFTLMSFIRSFWNFFQNQFFKQSHILHTKSYTTLEFIVNSRKSFGSYIRLISFILFLFNKKNRKIVLPITLTFILSGFIYCLQDYKSGTLAGTTILDVFYLFFIPFGIYIVHKVFTSNRIKIIASTITIFLIFSLSFVTMRGTLYTFNFANKPIKTIEKNEYTVTQGYVDAASFFCSKYDNIQALRIEEIRYFVYCKTPPIKELNFAKIAAQNRYGKKVDDILQLVRDKKSPKFAYAVSNLNEIATDGTIKVLNENGYKLNGIYRQLFPLGKHGMYNLIYTRDPVYTN